MNNGFFDYQNNEMLKHQETFSELIDRIGIKEVFFGTDVDDATAGKLKDYFLLDRLCAPEQRFLWLFRRRLNAYYPIYQDQISMWAERKTKEWFFDNYKTEEATHDGTGNTTENLTSELNRTLDRVLNMIHSGKTSDTVTDNGETSEEYSESRSGESDSNTNNSEKDRAFAFRYPESNYTGGIIPYDMTENPNVEFIDSQSDAIKKGESSTSGTESGDTDGNRSGTSKNERTASGTQDSTDEHTTKDTGKDTQESDRNQNTTEHWQEERRRQGDNLNKLVDELIAQIPQTGFFWELTVKLTPCFQNSFLVDEFIEEE